MSYVLEYETIKPNFLEFNMIKMHKTCLKRFGQNNIRINLMVLLAINIATFPKLFEIKNIFDLSFFLLLNKKKHGLSSFKLDKIILRL